MSQSKQAAQMSTRQALSVAILCLEHEQLVPGDERPPGWAGECKQAAEMLRQMRDTLKPVDRTSTNGK